MGADVDVLEVRPPPPRAHSRALRRVNEWNASGAAASASTALTVAVATGKSGGSICSAFSLSPAAKAARKARVEALVRLGGKETQRRQVLCGVEDGIRRFLATAEQAQRPKYCAVEARAIAERARQTQSRELLRQQRLEQHAERVRQHLIHLSDMQMAARKAIARTETDERVELQVLTRITALAIHEREARCAILQDGIRGITGLVLKAQRYIAHTHLADAAVGDKHMYFCHACGESFCEADAHFYCTATGVLHARRVPCADCNIVHTGPHTAFCPVTGKRHEPRDPHGGARRVAREARWPWQHGGSTYTNPCYRRKEVNAGEMVKEAVYTFLFAQVSSAVAMAEDEALEMQREAELLAAAAASGDESPADGSTPPDALSPTSGDDSPAEPDLGDDLPPTDPPSRAASRMSRVGSRAASRSRKSLSRAKSTLSKQKSIKSMRSMRSKKSQN